MQYCCLGPSHEWVKTHSTPYLEWLLEPQVLILSMILLHHKQHQRKLFHCGRRLFFNLVNGKKKKKQLWADKLDRKASSIPAKITPLLHASTAGCMKVFTRKQWITYFFGSGGHGLNHVNNHAAVTCLNKIVTDMHCFWIIEFLVICF